MKKIFVFLILAPIILRAQQNNYEKVRVFTTSVTATNSERLDSLTKNSLVNHIATNHNVTNYRQVYSFAKTQKLHEVHEFTCDCNADNLIHHSTKQNFQNFDQPLYMRAINYVSKLVILSAL